VTRIGTDDHDTERAFLLETEALLKRELTRRAAFLVETMPHLSQVVRTHVETPIQEWPEPVDPEMAMEFGGLRLEEAIIAELTRIIEERPLVDALERRIAAVQREEMELIEEAPDGLYLRDSAFWRDEDVLAVLNRLFTNWARWLRGEPLEGP